VRAICYFGFGLWWGDGYGEVKGVCVLGGGWCDWVVEFGFDYFFSSRREKNRGGEGRVGD